MSNKNINVKISPQFTEASTRENINSGDNIKTIFGKLKKWLSDLKPVAFTGSYNDLSDKPDLPESGVLGVKGNAETEYRTGNVNLTSANIGAATSAQGSKADSAVQTIQIGGTTQTKTNGTVNLPAYPTKSSLGLSNVENKSSATIRGELTSSNVTSALGYTPENINNGVKNLLYTMPKNYSESGVTLTYVSPNKFKVTGTTNTINITVPLIANVSTGATSFDDTQYPNDNALGSGNFTATVSVPAGINVQFIAATAIPIAGSNYRIFVANSSSPTASFTLTSSDKYFWVRIVYNVSSVKTFNDDITVMIRRSEITDSTFVPYAEPNYKLTQEKVSKSGDTITGDLRFNTVEFTNDTDMFWVSSTSKKPFYFDVADFEIAFMPKDDVTEGYLAIRHNTSTGGSKIGVDYSAGDDLIVPGLYFEGAGTNNGSSIFINDNINLRTEHLYLNSEEVFTTTVRYDTSSQGLTSTQKSNVRTNIGAGTSNLAIGTTSTTAAAGNHGHTDLGLRGYCVTISDWNSATTNGWYMASTASNAPNGDTSVWYFGRAIAHNAKYVFQEVWQFTHTSDARKSKRYTRICLNGTWGAWARDNIGLYDSGKWVEGDKIACVIKNNKENSGSYNPVIDVATVNGHWSLGTQGSTGNNNLYFVHTTDATSSSNMFLRYILEGVSSVSSTQTYTILTTKNYTSYCATTSQLSGKQDTITKTTATPTYVSNSLFGSDQIARLRYVKYNDLFAYLKVNLSLSSATTSDFVTVATLPFTVAEDIMVCAPLQDTTANATLLITGGTAAIKLYKNSTTSGWFRQAIFIPIED